MQASAFAWAEAYVKALAQCPQAFCVTDSGGVAEEVAKIMLNAYAKAIGAACASAISHPLSKISLTQ